MILFRADANSQIGTGHIMRCISLADSMKEHGKECLFVTAENTLSEIIQEHGHQYEVLHSDYQNLDAELPQLNSILAKFQPEHLIIDSYFVTEAYLRSLSCWYDVTYIDDLALFAYPVQKLVNYSLSASETDYLDLYHRSGTSVPEMLLGVSYMPLRKEFQNLPYHAPAQTVKNILVSTGGADPVHMALQMIHYLKENPFFWKYCFHFVIGTAIADKEQIFQEADGIPAVTLHENVRDMKTLINSCDIAVSACGSTLFELCSCSMPMILYILADNQKDNAKSFTSLNMGIFAGDVRESSDFVENLFSQIEGLCENYSLRKALSFSAYHRVNGNGAEKLAHEILKF